MLTVIHIEHCRSDSVVSEIALGGLEKEDKELHQLDRAVFSKVPLLFLFMPKTYACMRAALLHLPQLATEPNIKLFCRLVQLCLSVVFPPPAPPCCPLHVGVTQREAWVDLELLLNHA